MTIPSAYTPEKLTDFHEIRRHFPTPVLDADPLAVDAYWRAWRLAQRSFRWPCPGSPFVSNYIDESFCDLLFLWDTCFMTMFCALGAGRIPDIRSLDNFYALQLPNGEIPRAICERTGVAHPLSQPGTPASLNHPLMAWAELETFRYTADRERIADTYPRLIRYYRSFEQIRHAASGLYLTDEWAMDNSPRNKDLLCGVDTSAEVVLFARDLARIARLLGREAEAGAFEAEAANLTETINRLLWDEATGFYYDLRQDGTRHSVKTVAAFWTLLAGVASPAQAARLVAHLDDPAEFCRVHRVPTCSADEPGYFPDGHYWCGGVWAPTTMMVVRGLERSGHPGLAREIALNHHRNVLEVFRTTGTFWEMYAADAAAPGRTGHEPHHGVCPDFVGWSGLAPLLFLIEFRIGLRPDAAGRALHWNLVESGRCGVERFRFGDITASLIAEAADADGRRAVEIESDSPFTLHLDGTHAITAGKSRLVMKFR